MFKVTAQDIQNGGGERLIADKVICANTPNKIRWQARSSTSIVFDYLPFGTTLALRSIL
jgi:hypothetical protein